jgi:putative endonuclease
MYLYILTSLSCPKTYIGISHNVELRVRQHNQRDDKFTSKFKPWKLIYSEDCGTIPNARSREKYYKSCAGRKKLKGCLKTYNRE